VLFNFLAEGEGELSVSIGDIVVAHPGEDGVFGTGDDIRDGWLMVQLEGEGTFGYVPYDYIQSISKPSSVETLETSGNQPYVERPSDSHAEETSQSRPHRRSVMRTSLHFMASDESFRMQLSAENDWREKLRLVKERAAKLDSSRRGQEQKMEVQFDDMESQVEVEIEQMKQEHAAACVQFENTIENMEMDVARLQQQRDQHERLWGTDYAGAHEALIEYMAQVKDADNLARQNRLLQEQQEQQQRQEQEQEQEQEGDQEEDCDQFQPLAAKPATTRQNSKKRVTSILHPTEAQLNKILQQQQQQPQDEVPLFVPQQTAPAPVESDQLWSNHDQVQNTLSHTPIIPHPNPFLSLPPFFPA